VPRLDRPYQLGLAAGVAAATLLGLLVLSSRFSVSTPSMVDDWYYASQPAKSLGGLLDPFVHAIGARFRPGYELWSQLEWHSLGAPAHLTGPNLWGAARVLLFVGGAVLVPGVIAATSEPRPGPLGLAALCAAAGVVVFSGPWTDVDFYRLGPQEPVMFGAAACGAALLFWGVGRVIAPMRPRSGAGTALLVAVFVLGLGLWALGIYFKEASLSVLVLAPFLYLFLDRRWGERGFIDRPLWRVRAFQLTGLAMFLPVAHVLVMSSTVSEKGASLYGADRPSGIGGWFGRGVDSISFQWSHWPGVVGTNAGRAFAVLVVLLLAITLLLRRGRVPWLALGLIITGWAVLVVQGLPLHAESRYYLPSVAMFAMAALLLLAQAPAWLRWTAVGGAVALAIANAANVDNALDEWSANEADNADTARLIAALHPASCPVYMSNIDIERSEAMPRVLRWTGEDLRGPCRHTGETLIVGLKGPLPPEALGPTEAMRHVCAEGSVLAITIQWQIVACRKLRPEVKGRPAKAILRPNRLVPGLGPFAERPLCIERFGRAGCGLEG
jgi:hypothetical protein